MKQFKVGQIVSHKLTGERFVVINERSWLVPLVCRRAVKFHEFRSPFEEKDENIRYEEIRFLEEELELSGNL